MGLPLAHWMPIVTDLLQVATNGFTKALQIIFFLLGLWVFHDCQPSIYSLLPLYIFQKKTRLAYSSNHIIGSSYPQGKTGRFCLGAILGDFFVPVVSTRRIFIFVFFVLFFLIWISFLYLPEWKEKPAILV